MGPRDGPEHQDDGEQSGCGSRGVLEELQADVAGRQRLSGDPRTDDDGGEQRAAQELGQQPSPQDGVPHRFSSAPVIGRGAAQQQDDDWDEPAPTDTGLVMASGMQQVPSPASPDSAGASASTV